MALSPWPSLALSPWSSLALSPSYNCHHSHPARFLSLSSFYILVSYTLLVSCHSQPVAGHQSVSLASPPHSHYAHHQHQKTAWKEQMSDVIRSQI